MRWPARPRRHAGAACSVHARRPERAPSASRKRRRSQPALHAMAPFGHASPSTSAMAFQRRITKEARFDKRAPLRRYAIEPLLLRCRARRLLALEVLERFLGALLQSLLQLLLLFLEYLRIGRRAVIGLGEFGKRQRQADRLTGRIDGLNDERLPLLHLAEHVGGDFVVRHAAVGEADNVGAGRRLILVDDDAGAELQLHAERQRDAQQLLRLAFRLDQHSGDDRHAGLDARVLAGEADLLGAGLLALEAELRPRRIDELYLLLARSGGLSLRRRRLLLRLLRLLLRRLLRCGRAL